MDVDIEVTIPVLNEEDRLEQGVETTLDFLDRHGLEQWGIVIADNGSEDNTPEIATKLSETFAEQVRYMRIEQRGVGTAIRASWTASEARVVGYMDVDLATDLDHLRDVTERFDDPSVRVVNGSRLLPESVVRQRSLLREITSRGLNTIMRYGLGVHFTDAMCGFKFFERDLAVSLLDDIPKIPDWFVSAEMLVKAEWRGVTVHEIPVRWTDDPRSKAKIGKLTQQYLQHIGRLRREKKTAAR